VKDFGTSKSPKSTRQRDSLLCPGRPASAALQHSPLVRVARQLPQMAGRLDKAIAAHAYASSGGCCNSLAYRGLPALASLSMAGSVGFVWNCGSSGSLPWIMAHALQAGATPCNEEEKARQLCTGNKVLIQPFNKPRLSCYMLLKACFMATISWSTCIGLVM